MVLLIFFDCVRHIQSNTIGYYYFEYKKYMKKIYTIKKMEYFKTYINIEKEITLESKVENDRLFVFYNNEWVQLSREKKKT